MIPRSPFPTTLLLVLLVFVVVCFPCAESFSTALFQSTPTLQQTAPSKTDGIDIEMPDFEELFGRIQQVSPLARQVIGTTGGGAGFDAIDDKEGKVTFLVQISSEAM